LKERELSENSTEITADSLHTSAIAQRLFLDLVLAGSFRCLKRLIDFCNLLI